MIDSAAMCVLWLMSTTDPRDAEPIYPEAKKCDLVCPLADKVNKIREGYQSSLGAAPYKAVCKPDKWKPKTGDAT